MLFLCLKIFFARLIDVSLGTFRTINTVKGKDLYASLIGIVEITVWFLVVKEALNTDNSSYFIVISYALGFSVGTYIGGKISKLFIKSNLECQIIISQHSSKLINQLRNNGYGVTVIEANGYDEKKYMLYISINGKSLSELKKLVRRYDNKAFIVINETKYVENGYFKLGK